MTSYESIAIRSYQKIIMPYLDESINNKARLYDVLSFLQKKILKKHHNSLADDRRETCVFLITRTWKILGSCPEASYRKCGENRRILVKNFFCDPVFVKNFNHGFVIRDLVRSQETCEPQSVTRQRGHR